jgi:hypothetical protein
LGLTLVERSVAEHVLDERLAVALQLGRTTLAAA